MLYNQLSCTNTGLYFFSTSTLKIIYTSIAEGDAYNHMSLVRSKAQLPNHSLLFPTKFDCQWGNDKQVDRKEKIISQHTVSKLIAMSLPSRSSRRHDEKYMEAFLKNSSLDNLIFNSSKHSRQQLLPNYCSLLDFVTVDSNRIDVWCVSKDRSPAKEVFDSFQKSKGLSIALLDEVKVEEIWIGRDSEEKVSKLTGWAIKQWVKDQSLCPTGVISMDMEALQVLKEDFEAVMQSAACTNPSQTLIKNLNGRRVSKGTATQLPVRIMIGNGQSWVLMITLLAEAADGGAKLRVDPPKFQHALLDYLRSLPRMVGVGIRGDVSQVEDLIQMTSDKSFKFAGCIDIPCIAVLAGWNFPFHNMQALSVQALGAFLNKAVSCGDSKWGFKWKNIPASLQVYCLGDVKFGHQASVLFLTMLLRDIFPDPDITLSFTREDGHQFMKGFASWVADSLQGVEVDPTALSGALTRSGAFYSLRFRRDDGKLSSCPPSRISIFTQIIGPWPSIVFGGPRYLHQVRKHFLLQCRVLCGAQVSQWQAIMPYEITLRMEASATYALHGLSSLDYTLPADSSSRGLGVHPALRHLVLTGGDFGSEAVRRLAVQYKRVRREVVYEWLRLNLTEAQRFVDNVHLDFHYSRYRGSYLIEPQMIVRRCTNTWGPKLPFRAGYIYNRNRKWMHQEEEALEKAKAVVAQREKRLAYFQFWGTGQSEKTLFCKESWRGEIPRLAPCSQRRPSYLDDYQPSDFLAEIDNQEEEEYVTCLPHELNERAPGERTTRSSRKRRKVTSSATSKKPVAEYFLEDEYILDCNNDIKDSDLNGQL